MVTDNYTVVSKREMYVRGMSKEFSVDLDRDPERFTLGEVVPLRADMPSSITISGPKAEAFKLGDRFRLTVEQIV